MLVRKDLENVNGKLSERSNKELIEDFLEDLERDTNFHIENKICGNCYFLFEYEDNSICHFKIKELPEFSFALWSMKNVNKECWSSEYKEADFIFFAQPTLTIDKFKPSRSALKVPVSRYLCKPNDSPYVLEEWCSEADLLLNFMKKQKYEAFYLGNFSDVNFYDVPTKFVAFKEYVHTHLYYLYSNIKDNIKIKSTSNKIRRYLKRNFKKENVNYLCALYKFENFYPSLHLLFYTYQDNNVISNLQDKFFNDLSLCRECKTSNEFKNRLNEYKRDKEVKLLWLISD